jgi:hypothetical protein
LFLAVLRLIVEVPTHQTLSQKPWGERDHKTNQEAPTVRTGRGAVLTHQTDEDRSNIDYPCGELFGLSGELRIALALLAGLVVKFGTGIVSASVDLETYELASYNGVYKPF